MSLAPAIAAFFAWALSPGVREVDLGEREELALILIAPAGIQSSSLSELAAALDDALARRTYFRLRTLDVGKLELEECGGRAGCLSAIATRSNKSSAKYLLVISARELETGIDQFRAILIDNDEVTADDEREVHSFTAQRISSRAEVPRMIDQWIAAELVPICRADACDRPLAAIDIKSKQTGIEVSLDGRAVTSITDPETRLSGIRPGTRQLSFRAAGHADVELTLALESGAVEHADIHLPRVIAPSTTLARDLTFWTGITSIGAGAGVIAYSLVAPDPAENFNTITCALFSGGTCTLPGGAFKRFGDSERGRGLVPIAPLGVSMVLMGAGWSIASWLGSEENFPWLELGIGAAAFAISMTSFLVLEEPAVVGAVL